MILHIPNALDVATLTAMQALSARDELFADGKQSAGWHARSHKHNLQADASPLVAGMLKKAENVLLEHPLVQAAARPKKVVKMLLSRYEEGMFYGPHVDDALMNGERTDVSFTLFISPPENYEGGALVIDEAAGEREVKLTAGSLILYPSTALHRVEKVTRGTRTAVVGWIHSHIRHAHQREMLFDLDQAIHAWRSEHSDQGQPLSLLLKTRSNLLRLWAEP